MKSGSGRRFRIQHCVGRGGFGEVYRATLSGAGGLEAEVALKVLRRDIDPRGQAAQRLRDEGRVLSRLHHPSILRVHDLVVLEGRLALVTEFVDGEDLGVLLAADPPPPRALVEILGMVAGALDVAWHAPTDDGSPLRLVHRDIKPSNIRVGVHGAVKLLDFGIARADSLQREARTQTDLLVGSPAYMAPERFLDGDLHPASDVFALGATLYEGLARRRFYGDLAVPRIAGLAIAPERYEAHVARKLSELDDVEPALIELMRDLLRYEPEQRPTAGRLAARCDQLLDALRGETLAAWARAHAWHEATLVAGELDGRTLTEGSLSAPVPTEVSPARRPRRRRAAVGAALLAIGLSAPFGVSLVAPADSPAVVEVAPIPVSTRPLDGSPRPAIFPPPQPDRRETGRVAPPAEADPAPPRAAEPPGGRADPGAAAEGPGSRPAAEVGAPAATAPASPPPAAPGTADPEPPAPAGAPSALAGHVDVSGDASRVRLSGASGAHDVPGEVPPGEYDVMAVFNGHEVRAGRLRVRAGESHHLSCAGRMFRCEAR